jgi:hypoxanthine phosphoribosyltransferase
VTAIAAPAREVVSWSDLDGLVGTLAERLGGQPFDVLLAITRGGMVPAGMLATARVRQAGGDAVTAVLHFKPGRSIVPGRPDVYAVETDRWVVYPFKAGG